MLTSAQNLCAQGVDATSSASTQEADTTSPASTQEAAAPSSAPTQGADATSSASTQEAAAPAASGPGFHININWWDMALGPLFITAWTLFALGFAWRIYRFSRLTRVLPRPTIPVPPRIDADAARAPGGVSRVRRWVRRTIFGTNPIMGIVSLVFHVLLFLVPLLLPAHVDLLAKSTGARLLALPADLLDKLTLVFIVLGGFFLLRRILVPRVRALTTVRDYFILLLVAAPFVSAYMAHHRWLDYHTVVLVHMLVGDFVIAAVPWTKLGHMPFLILARFFVAGEYAWKPGNRRWQAKRAAR
jgi:nitrate reductase gamma subunit